MLRSVTGIHGVSPGEEKEGYGGKDFSEKEGFKPGMKEWGGDNTTSKAQSYQNSLRLLTQSTYACIHGSVSK